MPKPKPKPKHVYKSKNIIIDTSESEENDEELEKLIKEEAKLKAEAEKRREEFERQARESEARSVRLKEEKEARKAARAAEKEKKMREERERLERERAAKGRKTIEGSTNKRKRVDSPQQSDTQKTPLKKSRYRARKLKMGGDRRCNRCTRLGKVCVPQVGTKKGTSCMLCIKHKQNCEPWRGLYQPDAASAEIMQQFLKEWREEKDEAREKRNQAQEDAANFAMNLWQEFTNTRCTLRNENKMMKGVLWDIADVVGKLVDRLDTHMNPGSSTSLSREAAERTKKKVLKFDGVVITGRVNKLAKQDGVVGEEKAQNSTEEGATKEAAVSITEGNLMIHKREWERT